MIGSVRRRTTFRALRAHGTRAGRGPIRLVHLPGPETELAFAIGKRFGSAVERNRARRRLRAAFTDAHQAVPLSGTFLVVPSRAVLDRPYHELVGALRRSLADLAGRSSFDPE